MSFVALPPVPTTGLTEAEFQLLAAIHQNISILTGQSASAARAIVSAQITISAAPEGQALGASISGALANDVANLTVTVQTLISDVQALRDTLNILIAQLRS